MADQGARRRAARVGGLPIVTTRIETPLGGMIAGATDEGLCLLEFTDPGRLEPQLQRLRSVLKQPLTPGDHVHLATARQDLDRYFAGSLRRPSVPIYFKGTPFEERVWQELLRIPYAETISYAELARRIGAPGAQRAVGRANGLNRISIFVPCHRVVNSNGQLGGYGGGLWRKEHLLALEARDRLPLSTD